MRGRDRHSVSTPEGERMTTIAEEGWGPTSPPLVPRVLGSPQILICDSKNCSAMTVSLETLTLTF